MAEEKEAVLLVEDEEDICWALELILAQMELGMTAANNGKKGLELARQGTFAAALVDAKLPDIEGIELASRIQQSQPNLPLVLISGYFYQDDAAVRESIEQGLFRAFVSKPFEASEVKEALQAALRGK